MLIRTTYYFMKCYEVLLIRHLPAMKKKDINAVNLVTLNTIISGNNISTSLVNDEKNTAESPTM